MRSTPGEPGFGATRLAVRAFVLALAFVLPLTGCGSDPDDEDDPKIPPLAVDACEREEDCDARLFCTCGRCTIPCGSDEACPQEDPKLSCFRMESELLTDRCHGLMPDRFRGVCLQTCEAESDCGEDQQCRNGACVPQLNRAGEPATSGRPPGERDAAAEGGADAGP